MATAKERPNSLEELRKGMGLSMRDLGDAIGCTSAHVSRLEKGITRISSEFLDRLSDLFGVPPERITSPPHGLKPAKKGPKRPNRIEELRLERGLTMEQLAARAHTTPSTINKLEKGRTQMTWRWEERIAKALDVEKWELRGKVKIEDDGSYNVIDFIEEENQNEVEQLLEIFSAMSGRDRHKFIQMGRLLLNDDAQKESFTLHDTQYTPYQAPKSIPHFKPPKK